MKAKVSIVTWVCEYCGKEHQVEYATNSRYLRCFECLSEYAVTGLHIDGTPIIRLIDHGREQ